MFSNRNRTVTVSPGSIVPFFGEKLSFVSIAPAATMVTIGGETMVLAEATLLAETGSPWAAETVAELERVPAAPGFTTTVIEARAPLVIVPRSQFTMPPLMVIVPLGELLETTLTP